MHIFRFMTIMLAVAGLAAAQANQATKEPEAPKQVPSFDLGALDRSADPCADFYQFSCGTWVKNNPIPPDQATWGRFNELAERNQAVLREILEDAAKPEKRTPNVQKIGDYYASCMDDAAINKKGVAVLKPEFERIAALRNKADLPAL